MEFINDQYKAPLDWTVFREYMFWRTAWPLECRILPAASRDLFKVFKGS